MRRALRQDPDVILLGEMRDLETIAAAITAAETGHLVFGTLHTTGAARTVDRIIDQYPHEQQEQIRTQLSVSLVAVISQMLMPKADGKGRVAAFEIMLNTSAIENHIRKKRDVQDPVGDPDQSKKGMQRDGRPPARTGGAAGRITQGGGVRVRRSSARPIWRSAWAAGPRSGG
jgi:twitching motility protein PilT